MMMQSSPDGSALLVVERSFEGRNLNLRVFHHGSFGENPSGYILPLPDEFDQASEFTVSSLGRRKHVYLIGHQPSSASLHSLSLRISKTETEYALGLKKDRTAPPKTVQTTHNSLIDCFVDVWERFPIIPAIARDFSTDRSSIFITSVCYGEQDDLSPIPRYFKAMIRDFKRRFQKPAGDRLDEIDVQVRSSVDPQWLSPNAEACRAGEWFVELICLIPIHIAVARDNRFLPLQDGILSEDLSLKLLGSEIGEIIDAITMGPYEAILGSYMSTKPVKVVSSMGGQVIVALDFEGVHSLERSAQEDMLLVLFNAAISNLIMFRNNFALSRNIANMFTSFQAGTRLFDPAQNPTLFKGLLAIIIKDVANADKQEIVKEIRRRRFRSKFNEIVQREQGGNFITVLHDNQLAVMPWDVIESKAFYARFAKLGKELFKQRSTHMNAGEFLFTLKTLMAKLTVSFHVLPWNFVLKAWFQAQDWGSIDRTIIKHRTSVILTVLPKALKFGKSDLGLDGEEEALKNYDTQQVVDSQDTAGVLYLGDAADEREAQLAIHLKHFGAEPGRESGKTVQEYLHGITHMRVDHVRKWVDSNLARFMPNDHADITSLFRDFERLTTNLVANVQICLSECNTASRMSIFAVNLVISSIKEAARNHVLKKLVTKTKAMFALRPGISADRYRRFIHINAIVSF
ncbi:hypothetical protein FRC00_004956 [Tulasnella sp. 408]|nr:hypothetical protein FRC00_004956 [Tulasnella sp. 408]